MKKFRLLAAMVITVALLCTVALAADFAVVKDAVNYEIDYETGDLTITVLANVEYEVDSPAASIEFDKTAWTVNGTPTSTVGTAVVNAMTGYPSMAYLDYATLAKDSVLIQAVFSPIAGADQAGTEFKINSNWFETAGYAEELTNATYTVKAATIAPPAGDPSYTVDQAMVTLNGKTAEGEEVEYTNIWSGAYLVNLNGNAATKIKVVFDAGHSYEVNKTIEGTGEVAFKIAVVGAPEDAVGVPSIFTTDWVEVAIAE